MMSVTGRLLDGMRIAPSSMHQQRARRWTYARLDKVECGFAMAFHLQGTKKDPITRGPGTLGFSGRRAGWVAEDAS